MGGAIKKGENIMTMMLFNILSAVSAIVGVAVAIAAHVAKVKAHQKEVDDWNRGLYTDGLYPM